MNNGLLGIPKRYGPLFLYKKWDPYIPDENPHGLSCEFTDPADLNRFIPVNIDSLVNADVATTLTKGLSMVVDTQQFRWRCFLLPVGDSAEWVYYVGAEHGSIGSGSLIYGAGIVSSTTAATNTGFQNAVCVGNLSAVHDYRFELQWQNFGETAGGVGSVDLGIAEPKHLMFSKTAGAFVSGWSNDGESYYRRAISVSTPAYVGVFVINYSGSDNLECGFPYFRHYPVPWTQKKKTGGMRSFYK